MRTLSITLLSVCALAGCEKTIHEASRAPAPTIRPAAPAIVPAVDGVPVA